MKVIGGGRFLALYPSHEGRRDKKERVEFLKKLETVKEDNFAELIILHAKQPIGQERELMRLTNLPMNKIDQQVQRLLREQKIVKLRDRAFIHKETLEDLKKKCLASIAQFIKENPLKVLMSRGKLVKKVKVSHQPLLDKILEELKNEGKIELKTDGVKIAGTATKLAADTQRLSDAIENFVINQGYKSFRFDDITNAFSGETQARIKNVFDYLLKNDIVVKIFEGAYLHNQSLAQAKVKLMQHLNEKETIRAVEYKDVLGVSRNVARNILDFFFDRGVTVRTKGTHRLPNKKA
jgi:hypothetical protein